MHPEYCLNTKNHARPRSFSAAQHAMSTAQGAAIDSQTVEWCRRMSEDAVDELGKEAVIALAWSRHIRRCTTDSCVCMTRGIRAFMAHSGGCTADDCVEALVMPPMTTPTPCRVVREVVAHETRCCAERRGVTRIQCALCLPATAMSANDMMQVARPVVAVGIMTCTRCFKRRLQKRMKRMGGLEGWGIACPGRPGRMIKASLEVGVGVGG